VSLLKKGATAFQSAEAKNVIDIDQYPTIGAAFFEAATRFAGHSLLAVPVNQSRKYAPEGLELTYAEVAASYCQI
jgi:hypothetical protein